MLELHQVTAGYGDTPVLQNISLAFPKGQVTALLGPNGCGKSTLLKAALGLLPLSSGKVLLGGQTIDSLSPQAAARQVAYLAQSHTIPNITAHRMVLHGRFPYLSYPRRYRPEDYDIADRALRWVDGTGLAHRSMEQLSGGQRQKIYLAMALAQETSTILMDEPTTYLDIGHQLEVMALARKLADTGRAVVMVLHDLGLALQWSHRAAVLCGGELLQAGTPEEIFSSHVLDQVFKVQLCRFQTPDGWQYYCRPSQQ